MGLLADRFGANFTAVDGNVAINIREHREARNLSQAELAKLMAERGFSFTQSTIWKIEQDGRPVKVSELVALADALNILGWTTLLAAPAEARHYRDVEMMNRRAADTYQALKAAAEDFINAQLGLAVSAHSAREASVTIHENWTSWLSIPAERAVIETRVESEREDGIRMELNEAVEQVITTLRERGYDPLIDLDDIQSNALPASDT